jgi:hypothetical protein
MLHKRPAQARGTADHGWLQTYHSFSFASYFDPAHTQFRALRVINEDTISPGRGFGEHPHSDMEILTCVLGGSLAHKDSMGNGSVIVPGDVQRMYAGTGVTHSEFNASEHEPVHLMQIWLIPTRRGQKPQYTQKSFPKDAQNGQLVCLASPDGRDASVEIYADAAVYRGQFVQGQSTHVPIAASRAVWLQVLSGSLRADGALLTAGDGAAITEQTELKLEGVDAGDVLLFDLG